MLLLKGVKRIWKKFEPYFIAGLEWLGKEFKRLWKIFYPWFKDKLSNIITKEIPKDKERNECITYESVENRGTETECDVLESEELGNDVTASFVTRNGSAGSDSAEIHVPTNDVTESNLEIYKSIGSHMSGKNITGSDMSGSCITGSDNTVSNIAASSIDATESGVPGGTVTGNYGSGSNDTVEDDGAGYISITSLSEIVDNSDSLDDHGKVIH